MFTPEWERVNFGLSWTWKWWIILPVRTVGEHIFFILEKHAGLFHYLKFKINPVSVGPWNRNRQNSVRTERFLVASVKKFYLLSWWTVGVCHPCRVKVCESLLSCIRPSAQIRLRSDNLVTSHVSCLNLEPTPNFCVFLLRCFVPLLAITISGEWETPHPTWLTLLCRCCIPGEVFILPQSSFPDLCQYTSFSLGFLFGWVSLLLSFHLPLRLRYSYSFLVFRRARGPTKMLLMDFPWLVTAWERSVALLNLCWLLCSSIPVSAMNWAVAEVSRDYLAFECVEVGRNYLLTFFFRMSVEMRELEFRLVDAAQVLESGGVKWCPGRQHVVKRSRWQSVTPVCVFF